MATTLHRSNLRKTARIILLGVPIALVVILNYLYISPLRLKLSGGAPDCSWGEILRLPLHEYQFQANLAKVQKTLTVIAKEPDSELELIKSPSRQFWVSRRGQGLGGRELLANLLADHGEIAAGFRLYSVRRGDVVLDCGAHVGVFTDLALRLGAAKVVAIEPDPVNLECLRRNFVSEIAGGTVLIVPEGVWSSRTVLQLHESNTNSGMNSVVTPEGGRVFQIPVTTIDQLVADLGLERVDFIKMDIEGAEREALRGAAATLSKYHPRLMLDSYHRSDDVPVFKKMLQESTLAYEYVCDRCEQHFRDVPLITPNVTFWYRR
jgi:FkbM family methyltransferase